MIRHLIITSVFLFAGLSRLAVYAEDSARVEEQSGGSSTKPEAKPWYERTLSTEKLTRSILSNPDLMKKLEALAEDTEVQSVLADPDIQKALNDNDWLTLLRNRKIRNLTNNIKIRKTVSDILDEILPDNKKQPDPLQAP